MELKAGARVPIDTAYEERALYTISGTIEVAGDTFAAGRLLVLRAGDAVTIEAGSAARLMLFGGAPMDGPRYIWWNFVPHVSSGLRPPKRNGLEVASTRSWR